MTTIPWRMRGDVMEACSCNVTCPCNFASTPSRLPCEAIVGWRIEKGNYGDVQLDALNIVLYFSLPGYIFDGNITGGFYFDERADPDQTEALTTVFYGRAGGWPAALTGLFASQLPPKRVPITYEKVDGEYSIAVPGLLDVGSERVPNPIPDQPPLDPKVSDLVVPFYTGTASVRRSRVLKLTDPALSFDHSRHSSLIGHFEYSGP